MSNIGLKKFTGLKCPSCGHDKAKQRKFKIKGSPYYDIRTVCNKCGYGKPDGRKSY